jgi:hypothetical protein
MKLLSPVTVCLIAAAFFGVLQLHDSFLGQIQIQQSIDKGMDMGMDIDIPVEQILLSTQLSEVQAATSNKNRRRQSIQVPKFLQADQRNESVLFVHVGKAGGSSVRSLVNKSRQICRHSPRSRRRCALSRVTGELNNVVHMWAHQDTYPNYKQYLVPVRNPIDRLISWFNYERHLFRVAGRQRIHSYLGRLIYCYPDVNDLITNGLANGSDNPGGNQTSCQVLARECLVGKIPCYAHNFYNYEVYLEDLIQWRECNHENCTAREEIRIDVLRSEHSQGDMNRILELWTGSTFNNTLAYGRENSVATKKIEGTTNVTAVGIERLCRSICPELIAYKKILVLADNLNTEEVDESFQELDERCAGLSVDQICGVDFHYRAIKKQKKIIT